MYTKSELMTKMHDLIEMMGESSVLHEYTYYADSEELQAFIEHCEDEWDVEL
tara:strand:+ start:68 stop:223 length:156 start_codon:yes stop_codon:yes gene_type:complete